MFILCDIFTQATPRSRGGLIPWSWRSLGPLNIIEIPFQCGLDMRLKPTTIIMYLKKFKSITCSCFDWTRFWFVGLILFVWGPVFKHHMLIELACLRPDHVPRPCFKPSNQFFFFTRYEKTIRIAHVHALRGGLDVSSIDNSYIQHWLPVLNLDQSTHQHHVCVTVFFPISYDSSRGVPCEWRTASFWLAAVGGSNNYAYVPLFFLPDNPIKKN